MRIDRFLWFARLAPSRTIAQTLATAGRLRIDGRAIDRAHCPVRVGAVLTFATPAGRVRVLRIEALPARRGPAPEARSCYTDLSTPDTLAHSAGQAAASENVSQQRRA